MLHEQFIRVKTFLRNCESISPAAVLASVTGKPDHHTKICIIGLPEENDYENNAMLIATKKLHPLSVLLPRRHVLQAKHALLSSLYQHRYKQYLPPQRCHKPCHQSIVNSHPFICQSLYKMMNFCFLQQFFSIKLIYSLRKVFLNIYSMSLHLKSHWPTARLPFLCRQFQHQHISSAATKCQVGRITCVRIIISPHVQGVLTALRWVILSRIPTTPPSHGIILSWMAPSVTQPLWEVKRRDSAIALLSRRKYLRNA